MLRFAFLLLVSSVVPAAAAPAFKHYQNERFGFSVDIPADYKIVVDPANGDGLALASPDGSANLTVSAGHIFVTDEAQTFPQEVASSHEFWTKKGWKITYKKLGASWANYSGRKGDRILYARVIAYCGDLEGTFELDYPAAQQKRYEPIIARLNRTLKAPKQCP
ncbi:hypothetical protein [Oryzifoliimicrobium ureilyticus]|uniref:hypothetical protein n=1 Tax=Oryzifoliimicrobium ureilyticus TaxID=3113724 RepID=UPI0030766AB6